MDKIFRQRIITYFTAVAKKHKWLKYPSLAAAFVVLFFYHTVCHIGKHFVSNGKRYASIAFVVIFFVSSCSFSYAVFAERTGFTSEQGAYSAVVEVSDITLAKVEPVTAKDETLVGEEVLVSEHEDEETPTYTLDDLLENHEHKAAEPGFSGAEADLDGVEPVFDSSDWRLVLINKQHPIPEDYDFKLGSFTSGMRCDERVIEDLLLMMQAADKEGMNLVVRSPYRTSDHQEDNFNGRIKRYMRQGLSYMEAYKATSRVITIPGCSEHEVGLALDITSDTFVDLLQGFADTEEGKWLAEHSHEYGFILRYPAGKEYITGIEYEPWHFRYVGREAAKVMKEKELCLEEFWDKYL